MEPQEAPLGGRREKMELLVSADLGGRAWAQVWVRFWGFGVCDDSPPPPVPYLSLKFCPLTCK